MLKPGVKSKFLFGTIAIVLTVGLLMTVLVRIVLRESLDVNHEKRGAFIAANVARDSVSPVLTENYFELQMMINDLKAAEEDIAYIFVQRDDGEILAHTFGATFPEDLRNLSGPGPAQPRTRLLDSEKGAIHDFPAPLFRGVGGRVHVGLLEAPIQLEVDRTLRLLLGGVIAMLLLGSGLAAVLAVSITKPIEELSVAVDAMERGDMRTRVAVRSDDEVGHLAAAFNKMAMSRELAEEALLSSERKLRDITASLGEGLLVVDSAGRLTFMNPEAERLLGWSEEELIGRSVHEIIHSRKPDGSVHLIDDCPAIKVAKTGVAVAVHDDIYIRKDGRELQVAHNAAPILDAGRVVAIVIAFQDITERKKRETEREMLMIEHMDALSKVKVLSGMLPICSSCKKIRDDSGYWKQIESYVHEHSEAEFSHGICPECAVKLYPDYYKKDV